jgi:hypothetical protein
MKEIKKSKPTGLKIDIERLIDLDGPTHKPVC